jgi:hypothetical protein
VIPENEIEILGILKLNAEFFLSGKNGGSL